MAKTLIGNIKGKDGRGISKIEKTSTTGVVDTYTITYTDGTSSTYNVKNADSVEIQRQIVPSAAVESSTTASQAYTAGDYVVVGGVLRKVTSSITKGSIIKDSNSTETTVTREIDTVQDSISCCKIIYDTDTWRIYTISNVMFVYCNDVKTGSGAWDSVTCPHTLASDYRPRKRIVVPTVTENGGSWTGVIIVNTTGEITVSNYGNSGSDDSRCGMVSYPIMKLTK